MSDLDFVGTVEFWQAVVRITAPLALASLAALLCSRAGVLFIGIEGVMVISCFFGIAGTIWTDSLWLGVFFSMSAGIASALLFGVLSMTLRMGDVVGGIVLHIGALGVTAFLSREWFPNGASIGSERLSGIGDPFGGPVVELILHQEPLVYLVPVGVIVLQLMLATTRWGLIVRVSGESMRAAQAFGIDLLNLRFLVLALAGALAGLSGAMLGLAIVGTFDANMVNGRGFIALACVMLGGWQPIGVAASALLFGAADAFQFRLSRRVESIGEWIPLLPYILTLVAISVAWGKSQGPAEEGRGLPVD